MGLYLCVLDGCEDLDGVDVGTYDDFARLRTYIAETVESGSRGSEFATLQQHRDSRGSWTAGDCARLDLEIERLRTELRGRPAIPLVGWQAEVAKQMGFAPSSAYDSFIDPDCEPVLDGIQRLARVAVQRGLAIQFQ